MQSRFPLVLGSLLAVTASAQGPLTPAGAPAPTMKTLTQVEPRTIITAIPVTITEPGSYYLATNGSTSGNAIHIHASGVTLDLNGFTLTGDGGVTDYAILLDATNRLSSITIRNGKCINFGGMVLVSGLGADDVLVEDLQAHRNTRTGVWIESNCSGAVIRNNLFVECQSSLNLTAFPTRTISGVTLSNNRISGAVGSGIMINAQTDGFLRDISVLNNQITGASGTALNLSAAAAGGLQRVLIDSNHITRDAAFGILVPANARATVIRNVLTGCTLNVSTTGNTVGPTVTTVGTLATTGADISPWANFQN